MSNDNTRIRMETVNTSHKLLCIDYSNSFNNHQWYLWLLLSLVHRSPLFETDRLDRHN